MREIQTRELRKCRRCGGKPVREAYYNSVSGRNIVKYHCDKCSASVSRCIEVMPLSFSDDKQRLIDNAWEIIDEQARFDWNYTIGEEDY